MKKDRVLVVDDEAGIRELIQLFLQKKGYDVLTAKDGVTALHVIDVQTPDVVLLDIEMPGMNGFDVCQHIRKRSKVPILFVTCKRESVDKIKGLGVGGDDYITKPFDFHELEARIQAVLRRKEWLMKEHSATSVLKFHDLEIDTERCELFLNGKQIKLLNKEYQLLLLMAQHPNRVWTAEQLYDRIWGVLSDGTPQTIKVHISNLRRKLEEDPSHPKYIQTVRGFGYKFSIN